MIRSQLTSQGECLIEIVLNRIVIGTMGQYLIFLNHLKVAYNTQNNAADRKGDYTNWS